MQPDNLTPERKPYSTPELKVHGSWNDLTAAAFPGGIIDAGVFSFGPSDRALKEDWAAVDQAAVLEGLASLDVTSWRYRFEPEGVRHIGPVAQDFKQAFGVGSSDRVINVVDGLGVAYAAIQALTQTVRQQAGEIAELRRRLDSQRTLD
jgi:hypothetical protein